MGVAELVFELEALNIEIKYFITDFVLSWT